MSIIQLDQPSYSNGFARSAEEGAYPEQWRGLVSYWKPSLGITGTTTLRDVSGRGSHGTLNGSMTIDDWTLSGNPKNPSYALDFDGVDDYVNCGNGAAHNVTSKFTYSAWVKVATPPSNWGYYIVGRGAAAANGYKELRIGTWASSDRKVGFTYYTGGWTDTLSNSEIPFEEWTLVTVTFDSSLASENIKFYINAIADGTANRTSALSTTSDNTTIGGNGNANHYTNGQIDDVRIYNYALSQSEILNIYQDTNATLRLRYPIFKAPVAAGGRIMSSLVNYGGLAGHGGLAGQKGGLAA